MSAPPDEAAPGGSAGPPRRRRRKRRGRPDEAAATVGDRAARVLGELRGLARDLAAELGAPSSGRFPVDALDLALYWGRTQVVTVDKADGPLTPDDFAGVALDRAPRLLVRSAASLADSTVFLQQFVYPSPDLADYLAAHGILLYGTDAPSMDAIESEDFAGHLALLGNGIAILEGLDLSQAADGVYELVALPLKIAGGDGSPVRAALRSPD